MQAAGQGAEGGVDFYSWADHQVAVRVAPFGREYRSFRSLSLYRALFSSRSRSLVLSLSLPSPPSLVHE
jgi:hypothetical protein